MRAIKNFSKSISQINNSTRKQGVSISRLFKLLDKRSNYILTFVAFFLVIIPLPTPPGFSIILAIPAVFMTMQICYTGGCVYLPERIKAIRINKKLIQKIDRASRQYLNFIEKLTKKRLLFMVSEKLMKLYNVILLILACTSAIPIPFVCMVPATAGMLLSAGLIVKDGLLILVALIIGFAGESLIYLTIKTLSIVKYYLPL